MIESSTIIGKRIAPNSFFDAEVGVFCVMEDINIGFLGSILPIFMAVSVFDSKPEEIVVYIIILLSTAQQLNNIMISVGDDHDSRKIIS